MTSKKKLAKQALKNPELFSWGDLAFFRKWLEIRRLRKNEKKKETEAK
jgi:hypothetical protein